MTSIKWDHWDVQTKSNPVINITLSKSCKANRSVRNKSVAERPKSCEIVNPRQKFSHAFYIYVI